MAGTRDRVTTARNCRLDPRRSLLVTGLQRTGHITHARLYRAGYDPRTRSGKSAASAPFGTTERHVVSSRHLLARTRWPTDAPPPEGPMSDDIAALVIDLVEWVAREPSLLCGGVRRLAHLVPAPSGGCDRRPATTVWWREGAAQAARRSSWSPMRAAFSPAHRQPRLTDGQRADAVRR